ncbi:hypothetical protein T12_9962 [Trichinella patagoniensis]|uniref:Uncharacterized protein n=1 Tax=Trichinella patagoniensis TaxID=990121 RepID=A0A0V0YZZ6_9BILA|nr:hypothetical protein T12_9962 [Trichinella patagoniensis]
MCAVASCKNGSNKNQTMAWCHTTKKPDTILVFNIFYEVFGGGTRLAMPKTIYAPDSSSLKPGSGATEGIEDFVPCPDGTFLGVEGKLGDTDM